jgi:pentatricopeptide repeat protein
VNAVWTSDSVEQDTISYNTILGAYTQLGCEHNIFKLFSDMKDQGIAPDESTYTILLTAYSHLGKVEAANELFQEIPVNMISTQHHNCMVDILGRAGKITEALDYVNNISSPGIQHDHLFCDLLSHHLLFRCYHLANSPWCL